MTTREALLRAVLATPEDDLPRLVMADHLDEIGEAKLAEFVRVQIELEKIDPHAKCDGYYCQTYDTGNTMHVDCRGERLRNRERELWGSWPDTDDMRTHFHTQIGGHGPPTEWIILPWSLRGGSDGERSMYVRRGWISAVRCRLADWVGRCRTCDGRGTFCSGACHGTGIVVGNGGIGPRVCAEHPVERVVVTDREPWEDGTNDVWSWFHVSSPTPGDVHPQSDLPAAVYGLLGGESGRRRDDPGVTWKDFPTREAANLALSAALIRWAKSQGVVDE